MEWDEMQVLALKSAHVGLRFECHDQDCKRSVWRDFSDFPPTMRLRELRARARCDTCGSLRGYPVDVWPVEVGVHNLDKSVSMAQHRERVRNQDLAMLIPFPFGRHKPLDAPPRRPSAALMDSAHVALGVSIFDRYALTTTPPVLRTVFGTEILWSGERAPQSAITPDEEAPIVRVGSNGSRGLISARWGWMPGRRGWVVNARNLEGREWRGVLGDVGRRCLVPASAFAAPHPTDKDPWARRKTVWFRYKPIEAIPGASWNEVNRPPFAMAGFYRRWDWKAEGLRGRNDMESARADREQFVFVVVTTEPTSKVHPIQPKAMPVVLRESMWEDWLKGNAAEALGLQRRSDDNVVEIAWVGGNHDLAAGMTHAFDFG